MIPERRAFGDRLRRQRQRKNLSLTEIAATTKVGASHFAALERGDCSRWPGGVYNRAFIRAYAQAIGLDPDETAAEFAECHEPPPTKVADPAAGVADRTPTPSALRIRIEPDPYESEKRVARIVALVILDLMAVATLAAAGVLFTPASFWISLAAASIGYQVLSRVARSVPRTKKLPTHGPDPRVESTSETGQALITDP